MLKDSITLFQNVNKIDDFKKSFDSLNPYAVKSPRLADDDSVMESKQTKQLDKWVSSMLNHLHVKTN